MNTNSVLSFGAIITIAVMAMSLFGSITSNVGAQGQLGNDTTQIRNYLTEAIQALDSGNNTMVMEQLDLAEEQLEAMTGTTDDDDEDDDEDEGEIEEGPGEDEDGPGDVDANDEED